jgi:hypothetical protein
LKMRRSRLSSRQLLQDAHSHNMIPVILLPKNLFIYRWYWHRTNCSWYQSRNWVY